MTSKGLARFKKAMAKRMYTVYLSGYGGNSSKVVTGVCARTPEQACEEAVKNNPRYVATSARCVRILLE